MFFCQLDAEKLAASPEQVFGGPIIGTTARMRVDFAVNDPAGTIAFETFAPGDTVDWAFFHAETHVVLGGSADIEYTLPPNHKKIHTASAKAGTAYVIINGTRARFRVTSAEPYLHVCVIMPRYHLEKYLLREA
jgi:mannose-6-phosphate isomerase-like protein (cupin superfamily)